MPIDDVVLGSDRIRYWARKTNCSRGVFARVGLAWFAAGLLAATPRADRLRRRGAFLPRLGFVHRLRVPGLLEIVFVILPLQQ